MSSSTQVPQSGTPMAAEVGVGSDPVASISGSVVTPVPAPVYIEPSWTDPEKFDLLYSVILSTGVTIDTIDWSKVRIPPGHFQHSAYSILDDIRHGKHNIIHPSFTPSNNRTNDDDDNHLAPKSKKRKLDKISTSTPSKSKPKPKPKPSSSSSSTLPDHYYNPSPDPSDPKVSDLLQKAGVISKDGELNRKKRGRPAKDPSGISVNLMKQIALLDPNAPPPRKRGRPKKDGQDGNSGVSTPSRYHHDHEHSHRRRRRHNTGDDGGDGAGGGEFHSSDDERYSGIRSRSVSGEYDGYSSHEYDASPRSDKDHRHNEGESRRRRRRRSEVDAEIQSELDKIKDDMDAEVVAMIRKADEELQQQQQQHQEHQLQQQQQEHQQQQQQQRISPERVRGPEMFTAIPDILDDNTEERLGKKLAEELTKLRNEELAAAMTGNK